MENREGKIMDEKVTRKCIECLYWKNLDDPKESCKNDFASDPNAKVCRCFYLKEDNG